MLALVDIIACIGLTFIVTQSFIFKQLREKLTKINKYLGKLFSCPMCFGFWAFFIVKSFKHYGFECVNYAFISSLFCYIVYLVLIPFMNKEHG